MIKWLNETFPAYIKTYSEIMVFYSLSLTDFCHFFSVGYPFGGLLYALSGKSPPFVGIALMCMFNIGKTVGQT